MRIKMIVLVVRRTGPLPIGLELELPDEEALMLIRQGHAVVCENPAASAPAEKIVIKRGRKATKGEVKI